MIERLQLQQFLDSLFKEVDIHGLFFVSLLESASDIASRDRSERCRGY
jgi:hypothetical protein